VQAYCFAPLAMQLVCVGFSCLFIALLA